jgi:DNA repair protein RadC
MSASIFPRWTLLLRVLRAGALSTGLRPSGFAEAPETARRAVAPGREKAAMHATLEKIEQAFKGELPPQESNVPFASLGPHGHRARMREIIIARGGNALPDYMVLEMLLFFAQPKGDTKPLAKHLINIFGSFAGVLTAPTEKLLEVTGVGEHTVAAIRLVQEAAIRLARAPLTEQPLLNSPDRLENYLRTVMGWEPIEQFRVLFLDSRNQLIADEVLGRGTVNHTPVYPREVVRRALELHAVALILVHNHPSGDPRPSADDVEMTQIIKMAATPLEIRIHDHIILGRSRNFSFADDGRL